MYTPGCQLISERASLPFVHLENGAMEPPIGIAVFQSESVIFLVGEETDHWATAVGNCSLAQSHWQATHLLTLLAQNNVPNRSDLDFHGRLSGLLKLECIAFD
jgi:hypothetical protein